MNVFWFPISSGSDCHTRESTSCEICDSDGVTSSAPASTVTVSLALPMSRCTSTVFVRPTLITTPDTLAARNPSCSTQRVYVPTTGSAGKRYRPASFVVVVRTSPVAVFVSFTETAATLAPVGSVTSPVNSPTPPCAKHAAVEKRKATMRATLPIINFRIRLMAPFIESPQILRQRSAQPTSLRTLQAQLAKNFAQQEIHLERRLPNPGSKTLLSPTAKLMREKMALSPPLRCDPCHALL